MFHPRSTAEISNKNARFCGFLQSTDSGSTLFVALLVTIAISPLIFAEVAAAPPKTASKSTRYGVGASLSDLPIFPPESPWNQDISGRRVSPKSDLYIKSIGINTYLHPDFGTVMYGQPWGIPYVVVPGTQKRLPVKFRYQSESDPGPYPIPFDCPIQGGLEAGGDRHILIVDRDNQKLFELFQCWPPQTLQSTWHADSGAVFDLRRNTFRPAGFTSADAAGLPILPGLVRWDEVYEKGEINHALRFTASRTRRAYVFPARHFASDVTDPNLPPMGMRVRLKAAYPISGFPRSAQIILRALKKYGMYLADNGQDWFISGAPDPRWNDAEIHTLARVTGKEFEVVDQGPASDGR